MRLFLAQRSVRLRIKLIMCLFFPDQKGTFFYNVEVFVSTQDGIVTKHSIVPRNVGGAAKNTYLEMVEFFYFL